MIICMRAAMEGWMETGYVRKSGPYESISPCPICGDLEHPGKMTLRLIGVTVAFVIVRGCGHAFGWYAPAEAAMKEDYWKSPFYELTRVTSMDDESLAIRWAEGYDGLTPNIYNPEHPWYKAYEQGRQDRLYEENA